MRRNGYPTGTLACAWTRAELGANRSDYGQDLLDHPLIDDYWQVRMPEYDKINVPLLSAGNWGGVGLHPRGNIEGFVHAATEQKWLEIHGLEHFTHFYTDYGTALQKRFFGHFLKGEDTGWGQQPKVTLQVRHPGERFVERAESEWPLARTQWTPFYHDHHQDRPANVHGGKVTLHTGPDRPAHVLLPIIPAKLEGDG